MACVAYKTGGSFLFASSKITARRSPATYKLNNVPSFSQSIPSRFFSTATPNPPLELKTTFPPPKDFINTNDLFKNKKVLVLGIVGAFTGVCDNQLPPYAEHIDEFKSKGIDDIAVVSVNDPAVMKAFEKSLGLNNKLTMLADFDGSLTRNLGMEVDLSAAKLGKRSKRYAMVVDNGKIDKSKMFVEEKPGELKVSSADNVLKNL